MQHFFTSMHIEEHRNSLPSEIANHILRKIFTGELMQGTRLIETDIAQELNVSNIPVREAFYILQNTGIIERLPRRGVRVKSISNQEIKDYTEALIEIYRLGLDYSKDKWEKENYQTLTLYLEEASRKLKEKNIVEYIMKCDQVCGYLFKVAGNNAFLRFYHEITYITNAYSQTRWNDFDSVKNWHVYLEHAVDAIVCSDFDRAKQKLELVARHFLML